MEGKEHKVLIIVAIIIAILATVLIGYIVYDNFIAKDEEEVKEDGKDVNADLEIDMDQIEHVLKQISWYYSANGSITDFNKISEQNKFEIAYRNLTDEERDTLFNDSLDGEIIMGKLASIFGSTISYTHTNYLCKYHVGQSLDETTLFIYDSATDTYRYNEKHGGHGGESFQVYDKIFDVELKGNQYFVHTTKLIWLTADGAMDGFYADFQRKIKLFPYEEKDDEQPIGSFIEKYLINYDEYKALSPVYTYIFEIKNDKYVLVGYEAK